MSAGAHPERQCQRRAMAGVIALGVLGTLLGLALAPAELPSRTDPSVLDVVFGNPGMIVVARVLLVFAAVVLAAGGAFVLGSMAVRVRNGDWLRRVGPFEVSETAAADLAAQVAYWRSATIDRQRRLDEIAAMAGDAGRMVEGSGAVKDDDAESHG